jgi:hypothetical protein
MPVGSTATFGLVMVMMLVLLMQQVRTELALKLIFFVSAEFSTLGIKPFLDKHHSFCCL